MSSKPQKKFKTVEEYIAAFPKEIQEILENMRSIIKSAAPKAEEMISYNMPAFQLDKMLVYYAAWHSHIGFYPTASGIEEFKEDLSKYENSKGAIKFPIDKPLPASLITKIVKFRVKENLEKTNSKILAKKFREIRNK
jgi:uncharacterized protein YdhG (YjbR/CyaY superfamily)